MKTSPTKILLDESEMPTQWYNVVADLPTPPHVIAALADGAADPATHQYPSNQGEFGFREAVAGFYATRFGVALDPASQIVPAPATPVPALVQYKWLP